MSKKIDGRKERSGRKPKYNPEMNTHAEQLAAKGLPDTEIAPMLGITRQSMDNYKKKYPVFFASLNRGREISNNEVVRSAFLRATGYSHPDVHISAYQGKITKTPIIKHYPPDPHSFIFWLINRMPAEFQSKKIFALGDADDPAAAKKIVDKVVKALQEIKSQTAKSKYDQTKKKGE